VTAVATRSLQSCLQPVQELLPLAAKKYQDDIEYVHHLRVWTRRADAAIEMYRDLLPDWRAAWIEEQLARIRKATNDARDADVFARRLERDDAPAAKSLLKDVRKYRREVQPLVTDIFARMNKKKGRFGRRVEKLLKRVRLRGKRRKSKEPTYRVWAEFQLRPILAEFFEMATSDLKDTEQLHQFRIVGKKLRYALELLGAAFGSELRKETYPQLEKLQAHLGTINDHASAIERIRHWIDECEDAEQSKYLREMLKRERDRLAESRRRFNTWWTTSRCAHLRKSFEASLGENCTARKTA